MLIIAAVFIISCIQNFLTTREIHYIAQSNSVRAAAWAGVSSSVGFALIMVVVRMDKWILLLPYVLGDVLATWIALRKFDRSKKHVD